MTPEKLTKKHLLDMSSTGQNESNRPKTYPLHCSAYTRGTENTPAFAVLGENILQENFKNLASMWFIRAMIHVFLVKIC